MKNNKTQLSVTLDAVIVEKINKLCRQEHLNFSTKLNQMLHHYFDVTRK